MACMKVTKEKLDETLHHTIVRNPCYCIVGLLFGFTSLSRLVCVYSRYNYACSVEATAQHLSSCLDVWMQFGVSEFYKPKSPR